MKNQFWTLYKAGLAAMFWTGKKNAKNKKQVKAANASGQIIGWTIAALIITFYEFIFMSMLHGEGATKVFPPMVAMASMFMTLLTTVSYAKMLLFEAKDHDLLFSLPVSGKTIIASKLAVMYTLDSILNLIMLIPCGILYGIYAKPQISFYFMYAAMIVFTTMIPILFGSVVSAGISFVATRFRHAKIVLTILYILFFIGVMSLSMSFGMMEGSEETMLIGPVLEGFLNNASRYYPPIGWFAEGAMDGKLSSALLFIGVSLGAFAIVVLVFGKFYGKIHETFRPRVFRRDYKVSEKSGSIFISLMKKDLKRITSSAGLLMNQLTGLMMLIVFAIMFSMMDLGAEAEEAAQVSELFSVMIPFLFAMAATMICDTSTSISLEGKTFPLLKSFPISAKMILDSKMALHMALCTPVIILAGLFVSFMNGFPILGMLSSIVIPLCYAYISGVAGLLINLKKYKFDWTNELMVAKNSLPIVLTIIGGIILSVIPMVIALVLFLMLESTTFVLSVFMTVSVIVAIAMGFLLNAVGEKWFQQIEY